MCVVTVPFVDIGGIVYHLCLKNINFHNFIGYMHVVYNYDIQYYWKICLWCLKSLSTIKPAQILFHSKGPHTVTKMDDNI
jgi:hypothetical protein